MSIKTKIIITFSLLTAVVAIILSRVSYLSVREIYLNQLSDQTNMLTTVIAKNLDHRYLPFLDASSSNSLAVTHYRETLQNLAAEMQLPNIFIFDGQFRVLAQSVENSPVGSPDSRLLLNRTEIHTLQRGEAVTSLPFKGADGRWYLWGFYRLGDDHWLGIQENAHRLKKVESLSQIFWGIGFGGVVLTVLAGWLLARAIAKPIDRLVSFSHLLGQEKFDTKLPEGVKGELAILARAMDKMRHDLARHHREKETMLAQIAHEIRNPLGGIELLAGLVKEDLARSKSSTEYADKILEEISGLKGLITAYLNYSRPMKPEQEWVDIEQLVQEVRESCRNELSEKGITLLCQGNGAKLLFDRRHLRQILINLVSNSLKASKEGSSVIIEAARNGRQTTIAVSDDGPGIAEENLANIFEPFFTTHSEGTGLGLAICRKLCEENGAAISVANIDGRGCAFTIRTKE